MEGEALGRATQREKPSLLSPLSEGFYLSLISPLQVGILGEVSGEGFSRIFISSPNMLLQGRGLY